MLTNYSSGLRRDYGVLRVCGVQLPAKVLNQVLAQGHLLMYPKGRQIHESAPVSSFHLRCAAAPRRCVVCNTNMCSRREGPPQAS